MVRGSRVERPGGDLRASDSTAGDTFTQFIMTGYDTVSTEKISRCLLKEFLREGIL